MSRNFVGKNANENQPTYLVSQKKLKHEAMLVKYMPALRYQFVIREYIALK